VSRSIWMLGAGVFAGVLGLSAALAQNAPSGNATNGKKLYETTGCSQCHGYVGQGGAAGPKLIDPTPFPAFIVQLRTPRVVMPPYTERVMTDQQVADIYAHVKTFPLPADPTTIPLLR
jgi:mono/diheme cytochrome c family protein